MAQLIGDMTLSLTTLGRRASEGAMRRQRDAHWWSCWPRFRPDKTRGDKG